MNEKEKKLYEVLDHMEDVAFEAKEAYNKIRNFIRENYPIMKGLDNTGDLMLIEELHEHMGFLPSDGFGFYATEIQQSNFEYDWSLNADHPTWATHVQWYNK